MSKIENLAAVGKGEATNRLGDLIAFAVSEQAALKRLELRKLLITSGVSEDFMPRQRSAADAFRCATTELERIGQSLTAEQNKKDNDEHLNILVRDVVADKDQIIRSLVVEKVDKKQGELRYKPGEAVLKFSREDEDFVAHSTSSEAAVVQVIGEARKRFEYYLTYVTARNLRELVNQVLKSVNAVQIRPGLYFVPEAHEQTTQGLKKLISALDESKAQIIPVVDMEDSRDMIRDGLRERLEQALREMAKGLKNPDISKGELNKLLKSAKENIKSFKEYEILLSGEMEGLQTYLSSLKVQTQQLAEKAAIEGAA
ncbi:hypothetical protein F9B85_10090 [Heliorestis acidaminivorans]|uniref:Uncharacterized protein n=1 Tax=Heliorestis acidaminivorans TaxID=553427 RepID=A0A6I0EY25_9FIRM|nr:DUF6744 family protein [Heliorestis acidaminivorans]KAB2952153.1 hypothetical protein F9B85_10090 [Heliorestis acidaminivorans]